MHALTEYERADLAYTMANQKPILAGVIGLSREPLLFGRIGMAEAQEITICIEILVHGSTKHWLV